MKLPDSKTIALILATLVALGILQFSEAEQAEIVQAIVAAAGGIAYVWKKTQEQAARVQQPVSDRNLLLDGWQRMSVNQAEAHNASAGYASALHVEQLVNEQIDLATRVERLERKMEGWKADS